MKFKVFASFVGVDWDANPRENFYSPTGFFEHGWTDHEIMVHSNCKKNARKKIWKWAKSRGATQKDIQFVDDEMWNRDKSYKIIVIK